MEKFHGKIPEKETYGKFRGRKPRNKPNLENQTQRSGFPEKPMEISVEEKPRKKPKLEKPGNENLWKIPWKIRGNNPWKTFKSRRIKHLNPGE